MTFHRLSARARLNPFKRQPRQTYAARRRAQIRALRNCHTPAARNTRRTWFRLPTSEGRQAVPLNQRSHMKLSVNAANAPLYGEDPWWSWLQPDQTTELAQTALELATLVAESYEEPSEVCHAGNVGHIFTLLLARQVEQAGHKPNCSLPRELIPWIPHTSIDSMLKLSYIAKYTLSRLELIGGESGHL